MCVLCCPWLSALHQKEEGDSEEVQDLRSKLEEAESVSKELKETSKKRELELKKHLKVCELQ